MTVQLLHTADLHFGGPAEELQIEALEEMLPDLRPDAVVVSGDLTQRARHGEFQRARAFLHRAALVAPTLVIPGNHDVQWWWRPFVPFGHDALYRKYRHYCGDDLTPALTLPGGAVIVAANSSHGLAWGSLTSRLRDIGVKGHITKREIQRVAGVFAAAPHDLARVLVLHHNVLQGEMSQRMGLARWRQAQRRIVESGADVVLCGHDHQEGADLMGGKVVVATCGTISKRTRGNRPSSFNLVTLEPTAVQVTFFRWDGQKDRFRASDTFAFARHGHAERMAVPV